MLISLEKVEYIMYIWCLCVIVFMCCVYVLCVCVCVCVCACVHGVCVCVLGMGDDKNFMSRYIIRVIIMIIDIITISLNSTTGTKIVKMS